MPKKIFEYIHPHHQWRIIQKLKLKIRTRLQAGLAVREKYITRRRSPPGNPSGHEYLGAAMT